ncbi:MAG: selenocysteine-specific translation elongation factor [Desulfohalobiaceae bacterium]
MPLIMGTAGHIDHGKTTLVKALTGIDCDRLKEEKKRGITIELGFAFLDMPSSRRIGVVDVPGHEKFVKNMVAGAAGIDFVLLVVSADEGVMPQTREHLEICSLLGIEQGIVALTKVDSVDPDLLDLAQEDVSEFLEGSFLEGAAIVPVSAHTGEGLDRLVSLLDEMAGTLVSQRSHDLFRLPVDRVFSLRGHGTVVTGTLISGQVQTGDQVMIYPGGRTSRVRSLQVHEEGMEKAQAGQRTALNLTGLEVGDLHRGDVLALPRSLFPTQVWDLELTALSSMPKPLKHRKEVHFHHGAREVMARIYLLDREVLKPGETGLAQVRFTSPMVAVYGDRCVLRSLSPLRTIAGGKVINPIGRKVKRFSPQLERLERLAGGEERDRVVVQLELSGARGADPGELRIMTGLDGKQLDKLLQDLGSRQQVALYDREEKRYVSGSLLEGLKQGLVDHLAAYHAKHPLRPGLSRGEIQSDWGRTLPPKLIHHLLERCQREGLVAVEQDVVKLAEHTVSLGSDLAKLKQELLDIYQTAGIQPPNLNEALTQLGVSKNEAGPVLRLLQESGSLVRVKDTLYFSPEALEELRSKVRDYFKTHDELTPADFKELTGLSRKYAIPLMEQLDKDKVTMRIGDVRKLRKSG